MPPKKVLTLAYVRKKRRAKAAASKGQTNGDPATSNQFLKRNHIRIKKVILNEIIPKTKTNLSPGARYSRCLQATNHHMEDSDEEESGEPSYWSERMRALKLRICHLEQLLERVLSQLEAEEPCPAQPTPNCSEGESVVMGQPGMAPPVPLHEAVKCGDVKALVRALVRGENPNAGPLLDQSGDTALHCAARSGDTLSVELLLAAGAALNIQDARGASPLAVAVCHGHHSTVEVLLRKGVQVDLRDKDGRTPLMHAVILQNTQMVSLLVKHRALGSVVDRKGLSPLVTAARSCLVDILSLLICHSKPLRAQMEQALNIAGSSAAFMILAQAMPMAAICPAKTWNLVRVAEEGWLEPVRTILNNGEKCQCKHDLHDKIIQRAIIVANTEDILDLLWSSRPIATRRAAMTRAAAMGWATVLKSIISHWKKIKTNQYNETNHVSEIVDALYKVTTEKTALMLVQAHLDIARTEVGRETAFSAAQRGWCKILEVLIDNGIPVNSKWKGSTLLHSAASRGNTKCVQMLVRSGASVHAKNDFGWTALRCAAQASHKHMVDILLKEGADPTA